MEVPCTLTRGCGIAIAAVGLIGAIALGSTPAIALPHPAAHRIEHGFGLRLSALHSHPVVAPAWRYGRHLAWRGRQPYAARTSVQTWRIAHAGGPSLHASGSTGGGFSGIASVYSEGSATASGERLNPGAMTAAHRTLPFGTQVTVVNQSNGRSVVVRINDRGPFVRGRVIDLTPAAARAIGVNGLAPVSLKVGS
jgi:rare lipoprotein A